MDLQSVLPYTEKASLLIGSAFSLFDCTIRYHRHLAPVFTPRVCCMHWQTCSAISALADSRRNAPAFHAAATSVPFTRLPPGQQRYTGMHRAYTLICRDLHTKHTVVQSEGPCQNVVTARVKMWKGKMCVY